MSSKPDSNLRIETNQKSTSPKSNREYITSFTTTTTTTKKPHIEKGVKIIRELAEQAKTTTEPVVDGPIQSLTTPSSTRKSESTASKIPLKTTKTPVVPVYVPPNDQPTFETSTIRPRSTTHQQTLKFDNIDSTEQHTISQISTKKSTKMPTTTNRGSVMTTLTSTRMPIIEKQKTSTTTTTEVPININDIEDLFNNVPSTTPRKTKSTTQRTKPTTGSDLNDINFLRQVVSDIIFFVSPKFYYFSFNFKHLTGFFFSFAATSFAGYPILNTHANTIEIGSNGNSNSYTN